MWIVTHQDTRWPDSEEDSKLTHGNPTTIKPHHICDSSAPILKPLRALAPRSLPGTTCYLLTRYVYFTILKKIAAPDDWKWRRGVSFEFNDTGYCWCHPRKCPPLGFLLLLFCQHEKTSAQGCRRASSSGAGGTTSSCTCRAEAATERSKGSAPIHHPNIPNPGIRARCGSTCTLPISAGSRNTQEDDDGCNTCPDHSR